jgi:predicted lipid-binding transport protein (Tim44 family)
MSETFSMSNHAGSLVFCFETSSQTPAICRRFGGPLFHTSRFHSRQTTTLGLNARRTEVAAQHGLSAPDLLRWLIVPLLALAVFLMAVDLAEARRMGGGKSFGSKSSYSSGYTKPASPAKDTAGMERQATPGPNAAPSKGGFLKGGLGGMLGGLLMGGLIGSLFFGGGFGGIGIFELLLFAFAGYLLFRFIRSRKNAQASQAATAGDRYAYAGAQESRYSRTGDVHGWDALRSAPTGQDRPASDTSPTMPAGVNEAEFLSGAKALYNRLQASWNRRDLQDIRAFTSPEVLAEIERQAAEDPTPDKTDVLMLNARVLEVRRDGQQTVITVLYDALLREDQNASQPTQVREVWHIRRDESAPRPEWILEGIQQLEM